MPLAARNGDMDQEQIVNIDATGSPVRQALAILYGAALRAPAGRPSAEELNAVLALLEEAEEDEEDEEREDADREVEDKPVRDAVASGRAC
jgi:hypothetical protein